MSKIPKDCLSASVKLGLKLKISHSKPLNIQGKNIYNAYSNLLVKWTYLVIVINIYFETKKTLSCSLAWKMWKLLSNTREWEFWYCHEYTAFLITDVIRYPWLNQFSGHKQTRGPINFYVSEKGRLVVRESPYYFMTKIGDWYPLPRIYNQMRDLQSAVFFNFLKNYTCYKEPKYLIWKLWMWKK